MKKVLFQAEVGVCESCRAVIDIRGYKSTQDAPVWSTSCCHESPSPRTFGYEEVFVDDRSTGFWKKNFYIQPDGTMGRQELGYIFTLKSGYIILPGIRPVILLSKRE